jgi:class 3 adenylate cyclase
VIPVECGRFLAENIANARLVEHSGADHLGLTNEARSLDVIQEFVTGVRPAPQVDRELATIVFTDIVGSTPQVAELGDARWKEVLDSHDERMRQELARFRGREVKATGDGFLAAFDGPARAVRYALAASEAVRSLGIKIRAGVHTGECERRGDDLGARICSLADAGEVLASRTVTDLVAGSGLTFVDRGAHELKGVPGRWQLYAAEA